MRQAYIAIAFLLLLSSCKKDENPSSQTLLPPIDISKYRVTYDSSYFEVWSDSSWERYDTTVVSNGQRLIGILTSQGTRYYYGPDGYAAFAPKDEPLILFDTSIAPPPDQMRFGERAYRATTFTYQGSKVTMTAAYTLLDTTSIDVPFGHFSGCLHFIYDATVSAGGPNQRYIVQSWEAVGPGPIQRTDNQGRTIVMIRGFVNRKSWGGSGTTTPEMSSEQSETKERLDELSRVLRSVVPPSRLSPF